MVFHMMKVQFEFAGFLSCGRPRLSPTQPLSTSFEARVSAALDLEFPLLSPRPLTGFPTVSHGVDISASQTDSIHSLHSSVCLFSAGRPTRPEIWIKPCDSSSFWITDKVWRLIKICWLTSLSTSKQVTVACISPASPIGEPKILTTGYIFIDWSIDCFMDLVTKIPFFRFYFILNFKMFYLEF